MSELVKTPGIAAIAPLPSSPWAKALWWLMLTSGIAVAIYSTRYFVLPRTDAHFARYIVPLRVHTPAA